MLSNSTGTMRAEAWRAEAGGTLIWLATWLPTHSISSKQSSSDSVLRQSGLPLGLSAHKIAVVPAFQNATQLTERPWIGSVSPFGCIDVALPTLVCKVHKGRFSCFAKR